MAQTAETATGRALCAARSPLLPRLILLAAAVLLAAGSFPTAAAAQPLTERTPNLHGTWVTNPWNFHFQFSHRFRVLGQDADVGDIFTSGVVQNYPTFDLGLGLFEGAMAGVEYSTNSRVAGGVNEWQPFVKAAPLRGGGPARASLSLKAAYNGASKSADGELAAELRPGPVILTGALRGFSDGLDGLRSADREGEAALAAAAGAGIRVNRYVTLAADVADLVAGPSGPAAWSAGLHIGIPYTPHTLSLQATNVTSGTLQGTSVGDSTAVYWGFEFTVPFSGFARWGKIFGGEGPEPGRRPEAEVRPEDRVVEVEISDFAFGRAELRVPAGAVVRWVNRDPVAHTATSDEGAWDSGLVGPGETWSRRFEEPGRYSYHCTPHPFMTGTVVVVPRQE